MKLAINNLYLYFILFFSPIERINLENLSFSPRDAGYRSRTSTGMISYLPHWHPSSLLARIFFSCS